MCEVADSLGELPSEYEQIEEVQCVLPKMADFLQMHSSCHGKFEWIMNTIKENVN